MRGIAYRRWTLDREKERAQHAIKETWHVVDPDYEPDGRQVGVWAHSRPRCSCALCGNPRRWFGELTPQERRIAEAQQEDLSAEDE